MNCNFSLCVCVFLLLFFFFCKLHIIVTLLQKLCSFIQCLGEKYNSVLYVLIFMVYGS